MKQTVRKVLPLMIAFVLLVSLFVPSACATEAEATEAPQNTTAPEATAAPETTTAPETTAAPEATSTPEPLKELKKLTTTLDRQPVALMPVSDTHGTVSSKNATFVSLTWYDASGQALSATSSFETKNYRVEIRAKADDGYYFVQNLAGYLNNSSATVKVDASGKYATISREYTALVYAPRIIKDPWPETIDEGSFVSYVSTAVYATGLTWELVSPDGKTVIDTKDISQNFNGVSSKNNGTDKIVIYNIPRDMDGWGVRAVFHGLMDTETRSKIATIKVRPDPSKPDTTPAPTASPDVTPEPSPTPTVTPAPETSTSPDTTPAPNESADPGGNAHEHRFSEAWRQDADRHWRECDCGERSEEAPHSFNWRILSRNGKVDTEEGVCDVCGYTTARQTSRSDAGIISSIPMPLVFGVVGGLIVILIAADSIKKARRK